MEMMGKRKGGTQRLPHHLCTRTSYRMCVTEHRHSSNMVCLPPPINSMAAFLGLFPLSHCLLPNPKGEKKGHIPSSLGKLKSNVFGSEITLPLQFSCKARRRPFLWQKSESLQGVKGQSDVGRRTGPRS